jgi:hypothetical protein
LAFYSAIRPSDAIIGFMIATIVLVAASFASNVVHLIPTQGALYAISGAMLYSPSIFYLDEWFIARKGLAFGIMWAGTGASGLILQ